VKGILRKSEKLKTPLTTKFFTQISGKVTEICCEKVKSEDPYYFRFSHFFIVIPRLFEQ